MHVSRYIGPVPVSLDAYRREIERDMQQIVWPGPAARAALLKQTCLDTHQVEALGTAFAGRGLIFVHGPSGSGKTHLLEVLSSALTGSIRVPHALAVGESILEVFDPRVHRPCAESAQAGTDVDRRWVTCLRPTVQLGSEAMAQGFDPGLDAASGRLAAPLHLKANGGLLLIDDFDANRPQATRLIDRWRPLLETGIDRLRFPDGNVFDLPAWGRMVLASSLSPEVLGGEALVRRLAGRIDLARLLEGVYRAWVERVYRQQGCESLVLGRVALERAWRVHRGLPAPIARGPNDPIRRGTIATPQHRRAPGSIDVRNRQPHQSA